MNYTIENLIKDSVRVYKGMTTVYPQYNNAEEKINFDAATFNGSYASNNGIIAYIIDNVLYVTPATKRAYKVLGENFKKRDFYVPFSNWDYPKEEKKNWQKLLRKQKRLHVRDLMQDCEQYCANNGIGALKKTTLNKCLIIPSTGIKTKKCNYENYIYPKVSQAAFKETMQNFIGKFCKNNGRVVFVYKDGTTRVTKGYWILQELMENGYKEKSFFVPFSNGETILDPIFRERWEKIK